MLGVLCQAEAQGRFNLQTARKQQFHPQTAQRRPKAFGGQAPRRAAHARAGSTGPFTSFFPEPCSGPTNRTLPWRLTMSSDKAIDGCHSRQNEMKKVASKRKSNVLADFWCGSALDDYENSILRNASHQSFERPTRVLSVRARAMSRRSCGQEIQGVPVCVPGVCRVYLCSSLHSCPVVRPDTTTRVSLRILLFLSPS